jgi:cell division protein ZapA
MPNQQKPPQLRPASMARRAKTETEIYGESYQLAGDCDPAYLRQLASEVDMRMRSAAEANPQLGPMRVALLTLMELADEVRSLESAIDKQEQSIARRCLELERDIERMLGVA